MHTSSLILLLGENPSQVKEVQQALAENRDAFRLQCVERVPTALARISGGGVDVVLLDLTVSFGSQEEALQRLRALRAQAPDIPIIVLCNGEDENLAQTMVRAGATDYVIREHYAAKLAPSIRSAAKPPGAADESGHRNTVRVITFLGVKGGVGTSSVAVNVAASLAHTSRVVVVELQPTIATLSHSLCSKSTIGTISSLLEATNPITSVQVQTCLWPHRRIPGLSILFGPQRLQDGVKISPDHVRAILTALAGLAEFVVVDLAPSLSEANRAAIQDSDCLALVLERDPVCLPLANLIMQQMESWPRTPRLIGPVVVNRAALFSPFQTADMERELGLPTLAVIPPAPDLFQAAQRAQTPVVRFQPESGAASAFAALAARLATASSFVNP